MKTDLEIQKDVMEELQWDPILDAASIGVIVKDGVVTLSGEVRNYSKKMAAERAARRVSGVKALAEDIQVIFFPEDRKTDAEIAEAVVNTLKQHEAVQEGKIKIKVEDGIVKLEGTVEWAYQRDNAKKAIENLVGVRSVVSSITIQPKATPSDIRNKIASAFQRNASIDAQNITIDIVEGRATLKGTVRSLFEKEAAETVAWGAPGISFVDNKIKIGYPEHAFFED
ncbi:MAG TPA: BON domain-containing protein [Pseudosphingobacterium sp.]|nr:BON domain-containing protein [Pseudosphingobacterium sp.]